MSDRALFSVVGAALFVVALMLLVTVLLARARVACDHVVSVPYKAGERPVCVVVERVEQ